jgi:hypothetical protein
MSENLIYKLLFIALFASFLNSQPVFSQDINSSSAKDKNLNSSEALTTNSVIHSVKEAMKEMEQEKEKEHAQLVLQLTAKLDATTQDWITALKSSRELELNKFRHEVWQLEGTVNYPVPYDYYLRDFAYTIIKSDLKEGSLLSGYKGIVDILEKLYVETPHSSDATDVSKFFYTSTRTITLNLEYIQNKFVITDIIYEPFHIEPEWSKD